MAANKVEMSLDDIIKANKSKDKSTAKKGAGKGKGKVNKASNGILGRGKKIVKQRVPLRKGQRKVGTANASRPIKSKGITKNPTKTSTVATQRLVQKLVKKALAQSNVQTQSARRVVQRPKFRAARVVKRSVVANPLKLNPRSRIISRRPRASAQQEIAVRGRGPARFAEGLSGAPLIRQLNYATASQRPAVIRAAIPRVIVQQQQRQVPRQFVPRQQRQRQVPVYQTSNNFMQGRQQSVRDHISRLRSSVAGRSQQVPQVVYVTQQRTIQQRAPRQRRQNIQQQQVVFQQPQRIFQQQGQPRGQRRNFQNQRQQQLKRQPFFEPPNFLQRVPAMQKSNQYY